MSAAKKLRKPNVRLIGLRNLVLDETIQSRVGLDKEWARQLSEFRKDGAEFPPIGVIQTPDGRFLVWSGFHRCEAARLAGDQQIRCEVERGTERDARIKSAGSNRSNGVKPMGIKDMKKAVFMLLDDEQWWLATNESIASHVGLSRTATGRYRSEFARTRGKPIPTCRVDSDGRKRRVGIRKRDEPTITPKPGKGGSQEYRAWIGGRSRYLGTDPEKARLRAQEISDSLRPKPGGRISLVDNQRGFMDYLSARHLSARTAGTLGTTWLGSCLIVGHSISVAAVLDTSQALRDSIARALLNRAKHCPDGRAIVVCYDPPACEALDIARDKLGIEFMTPEELVESLKGE